MLTKEQATKIKDKMESHIEKVEEETQYLLKEGFKGCFELEVVDQKEQGDEGYTVTVIFFERSAAGDIKVLDDQAFIETEEEGIRAVKRMIGAYNSGEYLAFGPYRLGIKPIGEITHASLYMHRVRFNHEGSETIIENTRRYHNVEMPSIARDIAYDIRIGLHLHVRVKSPQGTNKVYTKRINVNVKDIEEYDEWVARLDDPLHFPANLLVRDESLSHLKSILLNERDKGRGERNEYLDVTVPKIK